MSRPLVTPNRTGSRRRSVSPIFAPVRANSSFQVCSIAPLNPRLFLNLNNNSLVIIEIVKRVFGIAVQWFPPQLPPPLHTGYRRPSCARLAFAHRGKSLITSGSSIASDEVFEGRPDGGGGLGAAVIL